MPFRKSLVAALLLLTPFLFSYADEALRPRPRALDAVDAAPRHADGTDGAVSLNVPHFEPVRDELVATGSVYARFRFNFADEELAEIEAQAPEFWNHMRLVGWEREGNSVTRLVPARGAIIRRDGESILIRESRYAFVEGKPLVRGAREDFAREPRIAVEVEDVKVGSERVEVLRVSGDSGGPVRADIIINVDLRETSPGMCHLPPKGSGGRVQSHAAGSPMKDLRCLDYNGPFTDGVNYETNTWRRFNNFAGSDCELALYKGYCWTEHFTKRSCQSTHGGKTCSALIGHSQNYHKHKF